jgi:endonuclease YncB( thermonuclease family)
MHAEDKIPKMSQPQSHVHVKDTILKRVFKLTKPLWGSEKIPEGVQTATLANTEKFSLETHGRRTPARVIDVYDGDTIVIAMEAFSKIFAFRVRLAHVNTPELKPALSLPNRDEVVERAKAARDFLAKQILGRVVWLNILGYEKYGRLLAEIYLSEEATHTINELIIDSGYGVRYELKASKDEALTNER